MSDRDQKSGDHEISVYLAPALVQLFRMESARLRLEARTVDEAIQKLNENWPGIRDRICEKPDRVRKHINVFVDGYKAQLDTHVPRNGQLTILTAISGG
ncbi:MAG: MoaD/ThiS family protein [Methyloligellaceae bacterium]